jgi:hypothetical protein
VLANRGFEPARVAGQYAEFMHTAEDHVLLEIIVSTYEDFLESEIGKSMHEERVLAQRSNSEYRSHLGRNVRYLMDYMLLLCLSPGQEGLTEVPIKLWVHYMPDTVDAAIRELFGAPTDASFRSNGEVGPSPRLAPAVGQAAS